MKLLIVDDDRNMRKLFTSYMEPLGEVTACGNGQEAIKAAREALDSGDGFDVIVMDIIMPVMDGQEALVEIRKLERDAGVDEKRRARIIMLTSLSDSLTIEKALQRGGADSYLTKPVTRKMLWEEINNPKGFGREA